MIYISYTSAIAYRVNISRQKSTKMKKVRENIKIAQKKQCKQHMEKGVKTFTIIVNDQATKLNARKRVVKLSLYLRSI